MSYCPEMVFLRKAGMKRVWLFAVMVVLLIGGSLSAQKVMYVSCEATVDGDGSKGRPFRTIGEAQAAVRDIRSKGQLPDGATVVIGGGTYVLEAPLTFTPADSGSAGAPVAYKAASDETVVLSGGQVVSGWEPFDDRLWAARIGKGLAFNQLFIDGERRQRARTPNAGFLRTDGPIEPPVPRWLIQPKKKGMGGKGFRFKRGDIRRWDNLSEVVVTAMHQWTSTKHWIKEIDFDSRVVVFTNGFHWDFGYWELKQRYFLENYFEALDAPGEWYYDREAGMLYYQPLTGEDMGEIRAVIPWLKRVVVFDGRPEQGEFVEHVTLAGLSVQHSRWEGKKWSYQEYAQANDMLSNAGVWARGMRNCRIVDCEVAHIGEHGVWLDEGCQHNTIRRCDVHDIGGGGIYVGHGGWKARCTPGRNDNYYVHHNIIDNNFIHDVTNVYLGAIGVWIGSSSHNRVSHNEICDMNYMGVNVGWCWNLSPASAHHNIVEYNHIHHIARRMLTDTGGIYTLGISPGTMIRNNVIHDVYGYPYHAHTNGIYNDEGSTGIVWEDNVVYNVSSAGYNLHWGRDLTVRNNVFAFYDDYGMNLGRGTRGRGGNAVTIERNIFYGDVREVAHITGSHQDYVVRNNVYYNTDGDVTFLGDTEIGGGNVVADPKFRDAEACDFGLKPDSPARKLGFELIETADVGLYGEQEWVERPGMIERQPAEAPEPPAYERKIDDDFEGYLAGAGVAYPEFPLNCTLAIEGESMIEVAAGTASGGRKSLRFVDAAGIKPYNPHLYYEREYVGGRVSFSCDLMNDAESPARITLDLRDYHVEGSSYVSGPKIEISAGGEVKVSGRVLGSVEPGRWFTVGVEFPLGSGAKSCTARLSGDGTSSNEVEGISLDKRFCRLDWVGILSVSKGRAMFYVDNIALDHRVD